MKKGTKTLDDYLATLPLEEQEQIREGSAKMIREGRPRRDGFAHYVMYTNEQGETVTVCLYIGIARKEDVQEAIANIRNGLEFFTEYPPESEWQLEPDLATQERCIEAWKLVNPDRECQFGLLGFISI
jgi:hypothetical protein